MRVQGTWNRLTNLWIALGDRKNDAKNAERCQENDAIAWDKVKMGRKWRNQRAQGKEGSKFRLKSQVDTG